MGNTKLLFKNATIATSAQVLKGDLLTIDGKIAAVGGIIQDPEAQTIDAAGKILLPGGVDVHTHFDLDVGIARASDDFYTGTVAAACGGTTSIVDHMAFGPKGCRLAHQVGVYHDLARRSVIDYGFHGILQHVDDDVLADMQTLAQTEGISSYKLYLTYNDMLQDSDVFRVLQRAQELDLVICVHCENDAAVNALRAEFVAEGKTQANWHPRSRPPQAEAEAVYRMLMLSQMAGEPHLYIVHLSTSLGAQAILDARVNGQKNVYAETCPQYLFLTEERYDDPVEGLKYILSPPLRSPNNLNALWHGVENGLIDTIATDHCPFFFATQKQRGKDNFTLCPNGAPGVELRMPLLFSQGYMAGRLTLPQMVKLCCTRPAQIFGLAPTKGDICEGADADLVLFDPNVRWTVTKDKLHENVDYTPYEGFDLQGAPILTVVRGAIVAQDGAFCGQEGFGQYLHRLAPV